MGRRILAIAAFALLFLHPVPALAGPPAVCLLPFTDARPVKSPTSVPYNIKSENTPEPIRAHPADGLKAVRRAVLRALKSEPSIEVVDLAGADPKRLASDPRVGRCSVLVGGAVFNYEGTVAVDVFGAKTYSGLVGFELVAADPRRGRPLVPPVAFAGRRQSDPVKADEDFGSSDRQTFNEWVGEALKVASASLGPRFVRPTVAAVRSRARRPQ
ncbi:MAG: hypothetical protein RX316_05030 [bacterium]|nr:hypothetical protein [bacterium]